MSSKNVANKVIVIYLQQRSVNGQGLLLSQACAQHVWELDLFVGIAIFHEEKNPTFCIKVDIHSQLVAKLGQASHYSSVEILFILVFDQLFILMRTNLDRSQFEELVLLYLQTVSRQERRGGMTIVSNDRQDAITDTHQTWGPRASDRLDQLQQDVVVDIVEADVGFP